MLKISALILAGFAYGLIWSMCKIAAQADRQSEAMFTKHTLRRKAKGAGL